MHSFSRLRHQSNCYGSEDWVRMQQVFAAAHGAQAGPIWRYNPSLVWPYQPEPTDSCSGLGRELVVAS
jgi:hypothetical protein